MRWRGKGSPESAVEDRISMTDNVMMMLDPYDVASPEDFLRALLADGSRFLTVIAPESDWRLVHGMSNKHLPLHVEGLFLHSENIASKHLVQEQTSYQRLSTRSRLIRL